MKSIAVFKLPSFLGQATSSPKAHQRKNPVFQAVDAARTLRDFYCEEKDISTDQFVDHFLSAALHPQARLLYPLARCFIRNVDQGDREIIDDLGTCSSKGAVRRILSRMPYYYHNWNFWRLSGKFRVSTRRIFACVEKFELPR